MSIQTMDSQSYDDNMVKSYLSVSYKDCTKLKQNEILWKNLLPFLNQQNIKFSKEKYGFRI